MKRYIRRPAVLCAAIVTSVSLLGPAVHAPASDPAFNSCGGKSETGAPRSCMFVSKGLPLLFHGTASSPGTARVWVTLDGYPETYTLPMVVGCAAPAGRTGCGGGYPDETTVLNLPHQASSAFVKLRCHFAGSGSTWEYGCRAGG